MKYKHIIWDWNGTLFNDVDACIETMNELLNKRNLDLIRSREYYREVFGFPVIDYYQKLGFDFNQESFDKVAKEYIARYHEKCKTSPLMDQTVETIDILNSLKVKQTIISASEQNSLDKQVQPFKIKDKFVDIVGIDDIFAQSKVDLAKRYFQNNHLNQDEVLFVGDTIHDYEVSRELGCDCVLILRGHQSKKVINDDIKVVNNFNELINLIKC